MILATYLVVIGHAVLSAFAICAWKNVEPSESICVVIVTLCASFFWPIIGSVVSLWYAVRAVRWLWVWARKGAK